MSCIFRRSEAIVLKTSSFGERFQLVILFTQNEGIVKAVFNENNNNRPAANSALPLTIVDAVYREKKTELFSGHELHLVDSFCALRENYSFLQAGCEMLKAVESSQLPGKPAPLLYELLRFYLQKIPLVADPRVLVCSFLLKLLFHEGLITLPFSNSEYIDWRTEDLETAHCLLTCAQLREINHVTISPQLKDTIDRFFLLSLAN